jgi:hypothetical protein
MSKQTELREEWIKQATYPGDHEPKLGCCGGDYCDDPVRQDHDAKIADWWLGKRDEELAELEKEVEGMNKNKKVLYHAGFFDENEGYNQAIEDILAKLKEKRGLSDKSN